MSHPAEIWIGEVEQRSRQIPEDRSSKQKEEPSREPSVERLLVASKNTLYKLPAGILWKRVSIWVEP